MSHSHHPDLLQATANLSRPASFPAFLQAVEIAELQHELVACFERFIALQQPERGLKVYLDRKLDNPAKTHLMALPPASGEPLEAWAARVFGGQCFGFVLNDLELYSNALVAALSRILHPTLEVCGIPIGGLSMLCLAGNYGFTPFGIHRDNKGDEGLLFHLGPGTKTYYTWETDEFLQRSGGREVVHDIEAFLPFAQVHVLKPGDLMFTPSTVFHIADTPAFSLSLVLDFVNPSTDRLAGELSALLPSVIADDSLSFCPPVHNTDQARALAGRLDFKAPLEALLQERFMRLRSNGGFQRASVRDTSADAHGPCATSPWFPIVYEAGPETFTLYVRGHRHAVEHHSNLSATLDEMNTGRPVDVHWLQQQLPGWSLQQVLELWVVLVQWGALQTADIAEDPSASPRLQGLLR